MNDLERAEAIYSLQEICRERAELRKTWTDRVIAEMEEQFRQGGEEG